MTRRVATTVETAWRMHRLQAAWVIPRYQRPYVWSRQDVE